MIPGGLNPMMMASAERDPHIGSVVLGLNLQGSDGATTTDDYAGNSWTFLNDAEIDTANFKYGNSSLLLPDGTTDAIFTGDSADLRMGSSNYTFETWFYAASAGAGTFRGLYSKRNSNSTFREFSLYVDDTNKVNYLASNNGTSWGMVIVSSGAITHDAWNYLRADRNGTLFEAKLNGSSIGTDTLSGALSASSENATIGALGSNGDFSMYGHIGPTRLTKGVVRPSVVPNGLFPES